MTTVTTYAAGFFGEWPELPPDVVRILRERFATITASCGANGERVHHRAGCAQG